MDAKTGALHWFDIPVTDFDAAKSFYAELLGWKFEESGKDYWVIKQGKEMIGGLRSHNGASLEGDSPVMFFIVDQLKSASTRARNMGATLVGEKTEIPDGTGSFQLLRDRDKNLIGLWAKS
jgi:predicted enzyme related to lactoylglutathione lyase